MNWARIFTTHLWRTYLKRIYSGAMMRKLLRKEMVTRSAILSLSLSHMQPCKKCNIFQQQQQCARTKRCQFSSKIEGHMGIGPVLQVSPKKFAMGSAQYVSAPMGPRAPSRSPPFPPHQARRPSMRAAQAIRTGGPYRPKVCDSHSHTSCSGFYARAVSPKKKKARANSCTLHNKFS